MCKVLHERKLTNTLLLKISKLFRLIMTIAPTKTEAERSFSLMKLIKNRLR